MVAVFPDDTSAASPTPLVTGDPAFAIVFGDEAEMPSASRQVGTEGPDTLTGTSGSDTLIGLGGADRLGGAGGHDRLLGGDRADILRGDEGDDVLFGGRGNDVLYGGDGRDSLYGEGGDDTLDGEEGRDTILGGAGRDWIFDSAGGDLVDGGAGVDILTFRHAGRFVFTPGATFTTQLGTTVMNIDRVDIRGGEGADFLVGGFRADFLRGEGGNDALYGRGGDDSIFGGNGNDTIFGGHGDDTLSGGGGSDFLYGGPGDDVLRGGASFDVFPGSDWFDGGPGADTFLGGGVSSSITFASSAAGVTVDLATGMGHGGDAEGDRYQTGFSTVVGSSFDDTLIGGRTILGGDGADRIVQQTSTLRMTGGADIDRFEFIFNTQVLFETVRITDFDQAGGEVIDLSAIDARPAPGDQMFTFLGTGPLTGGAGELRYESDGTQTTIDMTLDQSGQVYRVILEGDFTLTGSDFVL